MNNVADQLKYESSHMREKENVFPFFSSLQTFENQDGLDDKARIKLDTIISFHVGHFPMKVLNIFPT